MRLRAGLSRRRVMALMAVLLSAEAIGFDRLVPFLAARGGRVRATAGHDGLAALCSDLRCPGALGKSCLRALPAVGTSPEQLERLILADMPEAGNRSAMGLRHYLRAQSRRDFRDGRIVTVGGWMLSLTETRLYALAALLTNASPRPARYPMATAMLPDGKRSLETQGVAADQNCQ
jgi:hypothetical protein